MADGSLPSDQKLTERVRESGQSSGGLMYIEIKNCPTASPFPPLKKNELLSDPFELFGQWLSQADNANICHANAMVLATATKKGKPSSRTVLLKRLDKNGLIFFTNYTSRKAHELNENKYASATYVWFELMRQVSIEGKVAKISKEESRHYFATRPRLSQVSAWASSQDALLTDDDSLLKSYAFFEERFKNQEIPLPDHWGGYCLKPTLFEFWQGCPGRLHDRFRYCRLLNGQWKIDRLAP